MNTKDEQDRFSTLDFQYGKAAIFTSQTDTRFCYTMYVPPQLLQKDAIPPKLIVAVHGSSRDSCLEFRDAFAEFCRWNNCVVLCPLFPIGVFGDDNGEAYKYLKERDLRYDLVLLGMVNELEQRLGYTFDDFGMWGYSGGGQFVQRFFMLHPEKLWAASIGAPGVVTLLDDTKDWWVGVGNIEEIFGKAISLEAMRKVPVQMVVGDCDVETWAIQVHEGGLTWMPGINDSGKTRQDRLRSLEASFVRHGIDVTFTSVRGAAHDRLKCVGSAQDFFADVLKTQPANEIVEKRACLA